MTEHAPTDDEREALARLILELRCESRGIDPQKWIDEDVMEHIGRPEADRILAAGFRRTEAPEPSTRTLTPCGNLVCTGCRVCGCPALGIAPQGGPTDDEREALLTEADALVASWDHKGSWSADSPVGMVMRLAAALRRSEVPEPSAEERIEQAIAYIRASWVGLGEPTPNTPAGAMIEILEGELSFTERHGEPSDAQDIIVQEVSRLAGLRLLRRYSGFSDHWWDELVGGIARVALRAAGGAR